MAAKTAPFERNPRMRLSAGERSLRIACRSIFIAFSKSETCKMLVILKALCEAAEKESPNSRCFRRGVAIKQRLDVDPCRQKEVWRLFGQI